MAFELECILPVLEGKREPGMWVEELDAVDSRAVGALINAMDTMVERHAGGSDLGALSVNELEAMAEERKANIKMRRQTLCKATGDRNNEGKATLVSEDTVELRQDLSKINTVLRLKREKRGRGVQEADAVQGSGVLGTSEAQGRPGDGVHTEAFNALEVRDMSLDEISNLQKKVNAKAAKAQNHDDVSENNSGAATPHTPTAAQMRGMSIDEMTALQKELNAHAADVQNRAIEAVHEEREKLLLEGDELEEVLDTVRSIREEVSAMS